MPEIFLDAISFSFGSRLILDRVSLHVSNGERVFLIGPNGVGKSTLLRILTGDLTPDSGRIISGAVPQYVPDPESFDGSVAQFLDSVLKPLNELLKRFEQATEAIAAGDNLRAVEFDELLARLNALDVWSLDARVNETLAGLGLGGFIGSGSNRMMQTLSPGQRARLKLAALLMVRPEVLILDEPTNHLDIKYQLDMLRIVKDLNINVLAVLHDIQLACRYSDYLYLMKGGEIAYQGAPKEAITHDSLRAVYGIQSKVIWTKDRQAMIQYL